MEGVDENLKYLNELIHEVDSTASARIPKKEESACLVMPELVVPYTPQVKTDGSGVEEDRIEELELENHTDAELYEEFKLVWEVRNQCSECDTSKSKSELAGLMKKNLYKTLMEQTDKDLQVIHSEYIARGLPIPEPPAPIAPPQAESEEEEEEEETLSIKPPSKKGKKGKKTQAPVVVATAVDMETGETVQP
jgi:hypothetical protein